MPSNPVVILNFLFKIWSVLSATLNKRTCFEVGDKLGESLLLFMVKGDSDKLRELFCSLFSDKVIVEMWRTNRFV